MPAMAAATALPAWLNASLRPVRRAKARGPTMPSVTAAIAGAKIAPAAAAIACVAATSSKRWTSGKAIQERVTRMAAVTINARLAVERSISAPAGVWAAMPASAATDITTPIEASSHFCSVSR